MGLKWYAVMSKKKRKHKPKSWTEIFQSERKTFPSGVCVTRVIPDKRRKKPKHKNNDMEE